MVFRGVEIRQVMQKIFAIIKCCSENILIFVSMVHRASHDGLTYLEKCVTSKHPDKSSEMIPDGWAVFKLLEQSKTLTKSQLFSSLLKTQSVWNDEW